jgi:hypothetical protein
MLRLGQMTDQSTATIPQTGPSIAVSAVSSMQESPLEVPEHVVTFPEASVSELPSPLTFDRFPFGSPGALIEAPCQDSSMDNLSTGNLNDLMWSPFHSQIDWEVAHWAKMRGLSSSAVTELLAIPGVWIP